MQPFVAPHLVVQTCRSSYMDRALPLLVCSQGGGGRGVGGTAGPGPCMRPPPSPPAPRVLKDSGAGAMAPTAPIFLSHA